MKIRTFLLVLCLTVTRLAALERLTVAEADQRLAAAQNKDDGHLAALIQAMELTERCSARHLASWQSAYPGKKTHTALMALADSSALLRLPARGLPVNPPPSLEDQKLIARRVVHYVSNTLANLPNFLAIRQTIYFDDLQHRNFQSAVPFGSIQDPRPLQMTSHTSQPITYRDGKEVLDKSKASNAPRIEYNSHLMTNGEFGPVLNIILFDAPKGAITWSHWEQGSAGLQASFHYTVPAANSHYRVALRCNNALKEFFPAYDGEFTVEPESGTVQRLTLTAHLPPPCQQATTSIVTEFGPVALGEHTYTCPIHSISLVSEEVVLTESRLDASGKQLVHQVNDVQFTGYRLFHSKVRILPIEDLPAAVQ